VTGQPIIVPRTAARVILLDERSAVLLFNGRIASTAVGDLMAWFLPGGGAEDGEDLTTTAVRELFEETGLRVNTEELQGPVAVSRGVWSDGTTIYQSEDFVFVLRIAQWAVSTEGFTAFERGQIIGHHWWNLDELQQTDALIFPRMLGPLVARLLAGEAPEQPIELPWNAAEE
jgi:8-oxo-dGTP pyrophosphatase MutT (NUDIX family)